MQWRSSSNNARTRKDTNDQIQNAVHKTQTTSWKFLHPAPKPECDGPMRSKKVGFETVQLGERGTVRRLNNFSAVSNGAAKNHAEDHANYLLNTVRGCSDVLHDK